MAHLRVVILQDFVWKILIQLGLKSIDVLLIKDSCYHYEGHLILYILSEREIIYLFYSIN